MSAKETIKQINNLSDADWQRMKEHMDAKFPNMAMPNMDTFKEMVKLFGMSMELDEKKLNKSQRPAAMVHTGPWPAPRCI